MFSDNFQYMLTKSIIPHLRAKYPFRHRLFMGNDPKNTSESTTLFMQINNINHFPTPVTEFFLLRGEDGVNLKSSKYEVESIYKILY